MGRIYTRIQKKQAVCCGTTATNRPNTPEPTIVEVAATVFALELSMLLADQSHPKLFGRFDIPEIVDSYCYPEDVIHSALLLMIEEGTIEYRPDGQIEFLPAVRRRLQREGVR